MVRDTGSLLDGFLHRALTLPGPPPGSTTGWTSRRSIRATSSRHSRKSRSVLRRRCSLEQFDELAHSEARLSKNRRECPSGELSMKWNDDRSASLIAEFRMAPPLPDLSEAGVGERSSDFLARSSGQC